MEPKEKINIRKLDLTKVDGNRLLEVMEKQVELGRVDYYPGQPIDEQISNPILVDCENFVDCAVSTRFKRWSGTATYIWTFIYNDFTGKEVIEITIKRIPLGFMGYGG